MNNACVQNNYQGSYETCTQVCVSTEIQEVQIKQNSMAGAPCRKLVLTTRLQKRYQPWLDRNSYDCRNKRPSILYDTPRAKGACWVLNVEGRFQLCMWDFPDIKGGPMRHREIECGTELGRQLIFENLHSKKWLASFRQRKYVYDIPRHKPKTWKEAKAPAGIRTASALSTGT